MKTISLTQASNRRLLRFVDLWKEIHEAQGDTFKFPVANGDLWTLAVLRDNFSRKAMYAAISYEIFRNSNEGVVSFALCVALQRSSLTFPKGMSFFDFMVYAHALANR